MTLPTDCTQNRDSLKLVREGTSQDQRRSPALDPAYAPVNERKPEHGMVFAKAYSAFLQYYDSNNIAVDDWTRFFSEDVSVQLAIAAIQDVDYYRQQVQAHFNVLNDHNNDVTDAAVETKLREHLGALFSIAGTLAWRLDDLKQNLPPEIRLKGALQNLIQSQLAPAFKRLLLYYRDGLPPAPDAPYFSDVDSPFSIMGATSTFNTVRSQGLSKEWITEKNLATWADYLDRLDDLLKYPLTNIYGSETSLFSRVNHLAGHNLFTSIFDQFLKVYARVVSDAKLALEDTFTTWDGHEPHYALFLAFLRVFEEARTEINTLTGGHLEFYYREVLRLKEKPAEPSHAHLLVELAKHVDSHEIKADELFHAGKDALGLDAFFANDQNFVANKAKVSGLKTLYRHENTPNDTLNFQNDRLFASPLANSGDGLGAKLTTVDQSWHPFFNKTYQDGKLTGINMPQAEVGFAIASHYLWMAEGERTITIDFTVSGTATTLTSNRNDAIVCLVTTEKGWFEKAATKFISESGFLRLKITLSGADPAFTAYSPKVHGYNFASNLPVLLVKLRHTDNHDYLYRLIQDRVIETIAITVDVKGLKSLAVSNDFGSVDSSKPFQPFGASPIAGNALTIGSKEVFQKTLASVAINLKWQSQPAPFGTTVNINIDYLKAGVWQPAIGTPKNIKELVFPLNTQANQAVLDEPDFSEPEFFGTASRHGFVRLSTSEGFGQGNYEQALIDYIRKLTDNDKDLTRSFQETVGAVSKLPDIANEITKLNDKVTDALAALVPEVDEIFEPFSNEIESFVSATNNVLVKLNEVFNADNFGNLFDNNVIIPSGIGEFDSTESSSWPSIPMIVIPATDPPTPPPTWPMSNLIQSTNNTITALNTLKGKIESLAAHAADATNFINLAEQMGGLTTKIYDIGHDVNKFATGVISTDALSKQVFNGIGQLIDQVKDLPTDIQKVIAPLAELAAKVTADVAGLIENVGVITTTENPKPIPPTGPFITEFHLDYTTDIQTITLNSNDKSAFEKRQSHFYHLAPFGQGEQHPLLNPAQKVFLVPQFSFQRDNAKQDSNAEFYIGVTGLKPPQNLALLFQVADGTADPLSIKPDPHIHWSYLSGNEWIRFANHDVQDGTDGLLNSGVISFSIPDQASSTNTLLPSGQHWLRAAIAGESGAVCSLLAVSAQAMTVTFQNQGNDSAYSAQPLPSGTISKLDQPDAAVKQVSQPFASFGGRAAEQPPAFYTRISERLRHKDRAIALWDCEHLVLEAFPQIYKAKCLNHTLYEPNETGNGIYKELAAGHVTLVTIPNQRFRNLRDPLRPYTSLAVLEEIKAFLKKRLSCFAVLHVKNPEFEEVHVEFKVRLVEGADETFHVNKLQEAMTRFLSPWAFSQGISPSFGGKIFKSVLINFVEEQPYVDYVTDFSLFHHVDGEIKEQSTGIEGSKAVSILVSVPAPQHKITTIKSTEAEASRENCRCEP